MRSRGELPDGSTYGVYEVGGRRVRVRDDFENAQLVRELLGDRLLDDREKLSMLAEMLFCDPRAVADAYGAGLADAIGDVLRQAFGMTEAAGSETPVIDFDEDEDRIRATCLQAYGTEYEALARRTPYRRFCRLMGMAPQETPMGQALYFRTAEMPDFGKGKAASRARDEWQRAKAFYRLGRAGGDESEQAANGRANDAFAALKAAARRGGSNG